jgi:hypothetical protein
METFEPTVKEIIKSGGTWARGILALFCRLAARILPYTLLARLALGLVSFLHGYSHEGAYQMTPTQERDVLVKCMEVCERLTGSLTVGSNVSIVCPGMNQVTLSATWCFFSMRSIRSHEGAYQMTPTQERDVLVKCMEVCERLTGKRVRGLIGGSLGVKYG